MKTGWEVFSHQLRRFLQFAQALKSPNCQWSSRFCQNLACEQALKGIQKDRKMSTAGALGKGSWRYTGRHIYIYITIIYVYIYQYHTTSNSGWCSTCRPFSKIVIVVYQLLQVYWDTPMSHPSNGLTIQLPHRFHPNSPALLKYMEYVHMFKRCLARATSKQHERCLFHGGLWTQLLSARTIREFGSLGERVTLRRSLSRIQYNDLWFVFFLFCKDHILNGKDRIVTYFSVWWSERTIFWVVGGPKKEFRFYR